MDRKRIGSTLESFLVEQGIHERVNTMAKRKILAYDIRQIMKRKKISPAELARRMRKPRPMVDRLLDLNSSANIALDTISRACVALGVAFEIRFHPRTWVAKRPARRRTRKG